MRRTRRPRRAGRGSWRRPARCCPPGRARTASRRRSYERHEPDERHAAAGELAEVDGVAAVRSADRDRDVLGARRRRLRVPLVEHAEPPARSRGRGSCRGGRSWGPTREVDAAVPRAAARRRSALRTTRLRPPAPRRRAAGPGCGTRSSGSARARHPRGRSAGSPAAGTGRSPRPRSARRSGRRDVSARKPGRPSFLRTDSTSTPQRIGAAICSRVGLRSTRRPAPWRRSRPGRGRNSRPGNRSCHAGPLATRESHRSERQRSAIRCRSSTRCDTSHGAQVLAHRQAGLAAADDQHLHSLRSTSLGPARNRCTGAVEILRAAVGRLDRVFRTLPVAGCC